MTIIEALKQAKLGGEIARRFWKGVPNGSKWTIGTNKILIDGKEDSILIANLLADDWEVIHRHTPEEIAQLREKMRDAAVECFMAMRKFPLQEHYDLHKKFDDAEAAYLAAKGESC